MLKRFVTLLLVVAAFAVAAPAALAWDPSSYTTPIAYQCYPITQGFSQGSHRGGENEYALDIGTPSGTPVFATKSGTIAFEGWEGVGGIVIRLNHSDGMQTILAHLSRTIINTGQWVNKNQLIGYTGATGNVTGPHLHWALKNRSTGLSVRIDGIPGVHYPSSVCP